MKLSMNDFALVWVVLDMYCRAALLWLNYYWTIYSQYSGAAGRAGQAYPSGAPDVTAAFLEYILLVFQFIFGDI